MKKCVYFRHNKRVFLLSVDSQYRGAKAER